MSPVQPLLTSRSTTTRVPLATPRRLMAHTPPRRRFCSANETNRQTNTPHARFCEFKNGNPCEPRLALFSGDG
eukprot:1176697-Prorocentrum_minimum.AAC.1